MNEGKINTKTIIKKKGTQAQMTMKQEFVEGKMNQRKRNKLK